MFEELVVEDFIEERMKKVLDALNGAWKLLPEDQRPKRKDFSYVVSFESVLDKLLEYEKENSSLGLCGFNPDSPCAKGLSVLSIMATITDIFTDGKYRLGVVVDKNDLEGPIQEFCVVEKSK